MLFEIISAAQANDINAQQKLLLEFDKLISNISYASEIEYDDCKQILSMAFLKAIPKFDMEFVLNAFKKEKEEKLWHIKEEQKERGV